MAKTILVVEDDADADAVTILGESLRRQGYTLSASAMVARLSSGREALRDCHGHNCACSEPVSRQAPQRS